MCPVWACFRHPDKNKDPKAEDMFIKVSKSYEVGENTMYSVSYKLQLTLSMFCLWLTQSVSLSVSL